MPVSHLTLTVSNLPASTSFFLSCLQPLGYKFIGRHENSVGFGSEPDKPADFWIAEERPGVPAGAAHIAFPAPSRDAVSQFFIAALKAGGKIHGEPYLRDAEQGYFSAAVIDFDGNSIEAVNRPSRSSERRGSDRALTVVENGSVVSRATSIKTTSKSRSVVAKSEVGAGSVAGSMARGNPSPSVVTSYKSGPAFQAQAKPYPEPQQQPRSQPQQATVPYTEKKPEDGLNSAKAVVGTLLGAAAGAAIAYAMVKDSTSSDSVPPPQYSEQSREIGGGGYTPEQAAAYQAIEAGPMGNEDSLSSFARNAFPRNANSIIDGLTQCSRVLGQAQALRGGGGASEIEMARRHSADSAYGMPMQQHPQYDDNEDLPAIRAIEGAPHHDEYREGSTYSRAYQSTFISEFTERPARRRELDAAGGSVYYAKSSASSAASTIKPQKSTASRSRSIASSARSGAGMGGAAISTFSIDEMYPSGKSSASSARSKSKSHHHHHDSGVSIYSSSSPSTHSARHIPLPHSTAQSTYSKAPTSSSSRHAKSTTSSSARSANPHNIPLPASVASASPSTIFFDGSGDIDSGSRASRASTIKKSATFSHAPSEHSHRSSTSRRSSKFDEPVRPSDSVSQVSTNVSKRSSKSRKS